MTRHILIAALLAGLAVPLHAAEPTPANAPAAQHYTTSTTTIGELLDDPGAKAILMKHIPQVAENPQLTMARGLTLKQVQGYAGDMLSDEALGKIDWDLAKLPAKP